MFPISARGGDLFARIDGDSLPEFEAVKILKQVLDALKFMHDLGFMHLDLKVRTCARSVQLSGFLLKLFGSHLLSILRLEKATFLLM